MALVVAIGLLLSLPVVTGMAGGQIDTITAVVRVALAFGASWVGVSLVRAVIAHYASAPPGARRTPDS